MISRFFKKKPKAATPKKTASEKPKPPASREKTPPFKKILTAEGWKRLMMRKSAKGKK